MRLGVLSLLGGTLGPVVGSFGLAHCGGGGSGADTRDATADVSMADTGSLSDSTVLVESGVDSGMPTDSGTVDSGVDSGTATDSGTVDSSTSDSGAPSDASDGGAEDDAGEASDAAGASDVVDSGIPCDAASGCTGSMLCCSSQCVDVAHDPRNCGSCANACSATQFCTGTLCDNAVFTNLCANESITVVDDPYPPDNDAGASLGLAIAASCPDAGIAVSIVPQTQPGVLVPGDAGWRPNTGVGTTLVAGGGSYGQLSVAYMDDSALTPVYLTNDGTTSHIYQRSTGLAVVTANDSTLGPQHDFFVLEIAVEPQSGTLCFFGYGIYQAGTLAAGYFGSQVLVPNYASYLAPWYVYEWTDTNNDMTPDNGDAFDLVAEGP